MLNEYMYIIIATLVVLLILGAILLSKRTKKEPKEFKDVLQPEAEKTPTPVPTPKQEELQIIEEDKEEVVDDLLNSFDGSEEGDFGVEEELQHEEPTEKKGISKREVPAHEKITKQHFSEFSGTRLLVAEDNIINQKVIKGLLADSGIEVVIANDGQEALDILAKDRDFLMVLMDAHMPNVDGFEATRIIRQNPEYDHILVVALSGDTAADDIKKMQEAGMQEQLEKPLRMDALYDILYAYSGPKESEHEDDEEYVKVIITKELNGDKGLEICGGDEAFYHEILDEFIKTYENSTQELGNLLKQGQLQKADKLLLDLTGVTANIGAERVHNIAMQIRTSLQSDNAESYLSLVEQYKGHLERLIKDIKAYQLS